MFPILLDSLDPSVLVGLTVLAVSIVCWDLVRKRRKLPLPPKPPGLPIIGQGPAIGNAAKKGELHLLLNDWARQYGEVYRIEIGPIKEYYINSDRAVKVLSEIFDRASAQTSERPRWIVSSETMCNQLNVLFLHASSPRWKHHRRVINNALTSVSRADAALPLVHYETTKFLREVAHDPDAGTDKQELWRKIGRYTYSVLSMQTFGFEIPGPEYPVVDYIFNSAIEQIKGTLPGAYMVDIFPWLRNLPRFLKSWERKAQEIHQTDWNWVCDRLERVKKNKESGIYQNAFLPTVLRDENVLGFPSEEEAAYVCLMLIQGGADTSKMSTWSFMEAMMMYPDVQTKARREIENVTGDRIPVWDDINRLPYVRCVMKEVWRWRPPVALGHPHVTTRDITYGSYVIPKGSWIHLNSWAICHDPQRHEDPDRFWPERYAHDHTTSQESINAKDPSKRDHFAFGAGRRVCPGYHVAERSLGIAIMRLLWAFKIHPAPNAKLPLNPKDYLGDLPGIAGPQMPVNLTVLSEEKNRLIDAAYEAECRTHIPMEEL